jgi:hypothetical protein
LRSSICSAHATVRSCWIRSRSTDSVPLEALLRLATALDEKLGSPDLAKRIRLMVRASPWALRLLVAHSGGEQQRRTQHWFARFSGELRKGSS